MGAHRRERVEELLKSFIATQLLLSDDARDLFITVTAVTVTRDLKYATVFWCQSGTEAQADPDPRCELVLQSLLPEIKRNIGKELQLRFVPAISFSFDRTPFMTERIDSLLKGPG